MFEHANIWATSAWSNKPYLEEHNTMLFQQVKTPIFVFDALENLDNRVPCHGS